MKKILTAGVLLSLLLWTAGFAGAPGEDHKNASQLIRASSLIGRTVKNTNGMDIGSIDDFVFSREGKIDYLVLGYGGLFGFGERMAPIPWPMVTDDLSAGHDYFVVNMDDKIMERAPAWTTNESGYFAGRRDWRQRVRSYYGVGPDGIPQTNLPDKTIDVPLPETRGDMSGGN